MMAPRPVSAKEARQLIILAEEHAIAAGAYANRRPRDDARKLRMTAVRSRLRYRSFFRAISGWQVVPA